MYNTATFQFDNSPKNTIIEFVTGETTKLDIYLKEDNDSYKKLKYTLATDISNQDLLALGDKIAPLISEGFEIIATAEIDYRLVLEGLIVCLSPVDIYSSKYEMPKAYDVKAEFAIEAAYTEAIVNAKSYHLARMINNIPHCDCNPDTIIQIVENSLNDPTVNISLMREQECKDLNLNGMLALAQGSAFEPTVIKVEYNNNVDAEKIALVGKGITFDSGGYSIKTGRDISGMKADMGGASGIIGAMYRLVHNHAKANVVAYLMLTDNMINSYAMLPGDVITYRNGLSVELGNTDAEGRLVLADGLLLAEAEGADHIVDVATLTGNVGTALGHEYAAVYSTDDNIASTFTSLNAMSNEKVWHMPLVESYKNSLQGQITDLRNISSMSGAGSITAALFLSHFVTTDKWAHIDMAAMADKGEYGSKYTGYGTRILSDYVTTTQS